MKRFAGIFTILALGIVIIVALPFVLIIASVLDFVRYIRYNHGG